MTSTAVTTASADHAQEVRDGQRFEFGENWTRFLSLLNEERIGGAVASLQKMLGTDTLAGRTFLDAGSGSGLFSLAARKLGARVHSFDYDPKSFACTAELRQRFFPDDDAWTVQQASVLDPAYLSSLGQFDIVYSWGVLHHTGSMWEALANVAPLVREGGQLFIAIYNDQGSASRRWTWAKKTYNRLPPGARFLVSWPALLVEWGPRWAKDLLTLRPFHSWRTYGGGRGMSAWRDHVDWVGGYPFEVAKPEEIFEFYHERHFRLQKLTTCGGTVGCNEFVFQRDSECLR